MLVVSLIPGLNRDCVAQMKKLFVFGGGGSGGDGGGGGGGGVGCLGGLLVISLL